MKKEFLPRTMVLITSGLLLAGPLFAGPNDSTSPGSANSPDTPGSRQWQSANPRTSSGGTLRPASRMGPERLSRLMVATVRDQEGNPVGRIKDFIVSPASGRIRFAIVSLADQQGRLTAVPWLLIRSGAEPNSCTLNTTKDKVSGAQTFDAENYPDFSQPEATRQIDSYYGIEPGRPGAGRGVNPGANEGNPEAPRNAYPQQPTPPGTPPQQ